MFSCLDEVCTNSALSLEPRTWFNVGVIILV